MRVWDLPAGYLNRQSLLGEHRELHGIYSIITENKTGYANHPETLRWVRTLSGLAMRHRQLAAEMSLRGYVDRTPIRVDAVAREMARRVRDRAVGSNYVAAHQVHRQGEGTHSAAAKRAGALGTSQSTR